MPEKIENFEQVVEFIVRINEETQRNVEAALEALNTEREQENKDTLEKIDEQEKRHADAVQSLNDKELSSFIEGARTKEERAIESLSRIEEAAQRKYAKMIELERKAAEEGVSVQQLANEKELKQYEEYLRIKNLISSRREMVASMERKAGERRRGIVGGAQMLGKKFGIPMNWQEVGQTLANVIKDAVISGWREMKEVRRELVRVGGVTTEGPGVGTDVDIQKTMMAANAKWKIAAEGFEKEVMPAMMQLYRTVPDMTSKLRRQTDAMKWDTMERAMDNIVEAAINTGQGWQDTAKQIGDLTRIYGMTIDEASGELIKMSIVGRTLAKEVNESLGSRGVKVSVESFIKQATEVGKRLKMYNITLDEATGLTAKFAYHLEKGVISIDDLIGVVMGATKQDVGKQAFLAQEIYKNIARGTGMGELRKALTGARGDPFQMAMILKGIGERDEYLRERLGMTSSQMEKASRDLSRAIPDAIRRMSRGTTGGRGSLGQEMWLRTQFGGMFGLPLKWADTISKQRALIEEGGIVASQQMVKGGIDLKKQITEARKSAKQSVEDQTTTFHRVVESLKQGGASLSHKISNVGKEWSGVMGTTRAAANEWTTALKGFVRYGGDPREISEESPFRRQDLGPRIRSEANIGLPGTSRMFTLQELRDEIKKARPILPPGVLRKIIRSEEEKGSPEKVGPQASLMHHHNVNILGVSDFEKSMERVMTDAANKANRSELDKARDVMRNTLQEQMRSGNAPVGVG